MNHLRGLSRNRAIDPRKPSWLLSSFEAAGSAGPRFIAARDEANCVFNITVRASSVHIHLSLIVLWMMGTNFNLFRLYSNWHWKHHHRPQMFTRSTELIISYKPRIAWAQPALRRRDIPLTKYSLWFRALIHKCESNTHAGSPTFWRREYFRFDSSHQRWTFRWKQNPLNFFCARTERQASPLEWSEPSFFFVLTTTTRNWLWMGK